jgi:SAM-dependent methyltransferase
MTLHSTKKFRQIERWRRLHQADKAVKQCCAQLYKSDLAKCLLGDSFHPEGLALTEWLGEPLHLGPQSRVLDVGCGKGSSGAYVAEHFDCEVVGVDYGERNVAQANRLAETKRLARFRCERADAEKCPFRTLHSMRLFASAHSVHSINQRCARIRPTYSPRRKSRAERSHASCIAASRIGQFLPHSTCIAEAQPVERYQAYLREAGFAVSTIEEHDEALHEMVHQIRGKLLAAEVLIALKKLDLPGAISPQLGRRLRARARQSGEGNSATH